MSQSKNISRRTFLHTSGLAGLAVTIPVFINDDLTAKVSKIVVVRPVNLRCEYLVNPLGIDVVRPRLSWMVESSENGQSQSAYQIQVASSVDALNAGATDIWDSGVVSSSGTVNIPYAGKELVSRQRCYWQVRSWDKDGNPGGKSDIAWFEMGLLEPGDWKASWITGGHFNVSPLLRRSFTSREDVVSARLYICGQGVYEAFINGTEVSDEVLGPTLSYFSKRMLYDTYDVTQLIHEGDNAIGVWLAPGWFGDPVTWEEMQIPANISSFPDPPHALIAQLEIRYADGSVETIGTDGGWRAEASPLTPVRSHWEYCFGVSGEIYDATLEMDGWNTADFDDSVWNSITSVPSPTARLSARMIEPNRVINTAWPVKSEPLEKNKSNSELIELLNRYNTYNGGTTFTHPYLFERWQPTFKSSIERCGGSGNFTGGYVYDLGRHISGWVEIKVRGKRGDWVCMFGMDCHRLKGDGEETIRLRFIHRVVRYVPVFFFGEGEKPEIISVQGLDINSDIEPAGNFTCSDPALTELSAVIKRTHQAHMLSGMMMDSWQERFGTFMPGEASVYNWDLPALCNKLTTDFRDSQNPDGGFTMYGAPVSLDYPPLKDIIVHLPWLSYLYYGDRDILKANYQSIKKYTELIIPKHDLAERTWRPTGRSEAFYGDHGRPTSRWYEPHEGDLFETMDMSLYFQTIESIARLLGEDADAGRYREIQKRLNEKANRPDFLDRQEGLYVDGDQGCHALALLLDIVPSDLREKVADMLIHDIMEKRDGHLNTGFKGSVYLLQALIKLNRPDVAYSIIANETPPSVLTMLNHPLTPEPLTILPEFYSAGRNPGGMIPHPGFSPVGFWFYQGLGGIRPDPQEPGFRSIIIYPQIAPSLTWVNAEYNSIRGMIISRWEREGESFKMKVVIPANTTALIHVPGEKPRFIEDSGNTGLVRRVDAHNGYTVFSVPGGTWFFESKLEV